MANEDATYQQKELEKSLKYASYIQQSLFPKEKEIKNLFPESFLIYLPRDIVSGDFYWIHNDINKTIIAVGDSTGHGVPGAFLSILGISFLQLVISKLAPKSPSQALNFIREYLMKSLDQTGKDIEQKDGIDMALCFISKDEKKIQFSGAFSSLYIARDNEIIRLDGDKMPIGVSADFEESFTTKTMDLKMNDMVYLFTDGYPDQFGGKDGKKFKYGPFRDLLSKCSVLDVDKQKRILINIHKEWKGGFSQLDDITILGIRL
jgi:serine phosphatase RsbU (regulator of sigma subunit)